MFIGKLNERLDRFFYSMSKLNSKRNLTPEKNGNPFCGEELFIPWKETVSSGLDLAFSFSSDFLINRVVVTLCEDSNPVSVALYNKNKEKRYDMHAAETGKTVIDREISLSVEEKKGDFVLEFVSDFSDIAIKSIDIYGADLSGLQLFPVPASVSDGGKRVPVTDFVGALTDCDEAKAALLLFAEKWKEETGLVLTESVNASFIFQKDISVAANGFKLSVTEESVVILASDLRGFVMGGETVIKLIENGTLPICEISDAPFSSFRGVHLWLPAEDQMDFAKRLIKYVFSPYGYNHIIIELCGAMEYESHPKITDGFEKARQNFLAGLGPSMGHGDVGGGKRVRKALIRDLIAYARSFGIEVIPEIQSLGHVQYLTNAYPEIAEIAAKDEKAQGPDTRMEDERPDQRFYHCYCPSNPRSYEIMYDLIDEVVELFEPKEYVHLGHDEVYEIGVCPICSKKDPADLFVEDVCKLHAHLASKGLKMMIWSDMIQPVTAYKTPAALDRIPKDIFCLDFIWYFHLDKDIESNLTEKGFKTAFGNLYSSHFPRFEKRIRTENVCGGQISTWVQTKEELLLREGKMYDFLMTANMLWSKSYVSPCRYSYDALIRPIFPHLREQVQNRRYPSLCDGHEKTVLLDRGVFSPKGEAGCEVTVGASFDSIVFEHCTSRVLARIPWTDLDIIGEYVVTYADGTCEKIPLTYGGNISHYARRQNEPFAHPYYRHNGYSAVWATDGVETTSDAGEFATLYRLEWLNPRKEKIEKIEFCLLGDFDTEVIVNRVLGITR